MSSKDYRNIINLDDYQFFYTSRAGLTKGMKRKITRGLRLESNFSFFRRPDTREETFLRTIDLKDKVIYDIGGFHGIYTMFFSRAAGDGGKVYVFEPNRSNFAIIEKNVKKNGLPNVRAFLTGAGKDKSRAILTFVPGNGACGSANEDIKNNIRHNRDCEEIEIDIDTIDHLAESWSLDLPHFVKIDVEGLERDVLEGMTSIIRQCKPMLFIEIHGADMQKKTDNIKSIVDFLAGHHYRMYHVESGKPVDSTNYEDAWGGHLYCS